MTDSATMEAGNSTPKIIYCICLALVVSSFVVGLFRASPERTFEDVIGEVVLYVVIGLAIAIWAYVARRNAPQWQRSHYKFIIRTFLIGVTYSGLFFFGAAILAPEVFSGAAQYEPELVHGLLFITTEILEIAIAVWYFVRYFRGLLAFLQRIPVNRPYVWLY